MDRISLCALPTPLIEAKRLAESLQGPRIFIKRDDLTGLALGGNKARAEPVKPNETVGVRKLESNLLRLGFVDPDGRG